MDRFGRNVSRLYFIFIMTELDANYWNNRYLNKQTGWDIGYPSTPLKDYFDQLSAKDVEILIPGAGNAYEAEYLFKNGFRKIHVIDISDRAISSFLNRVPDFPEEQAHCADFFLHEGDYDLIIEQTFFCAVDPKRREELLEKVHSLLKEKGKYAGLLFDFPLNYGPPFGGTLEEYQALLKNVFSAVAIEKSYNSIKPRVGKEFFFIAKKA